MSHPTVERLSAFLERDLTPDEMAQVAAHVDECAQCAESLERLRRMVTSLSHLPELAPPPHLRARILERLDEKEPWTSRLLGWVALRRLPVSLSVAGTALAAMLVIGVGIWMGPEGIIDLTKQQPKAERNLSERAPEAKDEEERISREGEVFIDEPAFHEEELFESASDFHGVDIDEAAPVEKGGEVDGDSGREGTALDARVRTGEKGGYGGVLSAPPKGGGVRPSAPLTEEGMVLYSREEAARSLPESEAPRTEQSALLLSRPEGGLSEEALGEPEAKKGAEKGVPVPGPESRPDLDFATGMEKDMDELLVADTVDREPAGTASVDLNGKTSVFAPHGVKGAMDTTQPPAPQGAGMEQGQAQAVNGVEPVEPVGPGWGIAEHALDDGFGTAERSLAADREMGEVRGERVVPAPVEAPVEVQDQVSAKDYLSHLGYVALSTDQREKDEGAVSPESGIRGTGKERKVPGKQATAQLSRLKESVSEEKQPESGRMYSEMERISEAWDREEVEAAPKRYRKARDVSPQVVPQMRDRELSAREKVYSQAGTLRDSIEVEESDFAAGRASESVTAKAEETWTSPGDFQAESPAGEKAGDDEVLKDWYDSTGKSTLSREILESIRAEEIRAEEQRVESALEDAGGQRRPVVAVANARFQREDAGISRNGSYDLVLETEDVPALYGRVNQVAISNNWAFAAPPAQVAGGWGTGGIERSKNLDGKTAQAPALNAPEESEKARRTGGVSDLFSLGGVETARDEELERGMEEPGRKTWTWQAEEDAVLEPARGRIEDATREVLVWVPHEQRTYALVEFAKLTREVPSVMGNIPLLGVLYKDESPPHTVSATDTYFSMGTRARNEEGVLREGEERAYSFDSIVVVGTTSGATVEGPADDLESGQVRFFADDAPEDAGAHGRERLSVAGHISDVGGTEPLRILIRRSEHWEPAELPASIPALEINRPDASQR